MQKHIPDGVNEAGIPYVTFRGIKYSLGVIEIIKAAAIRAAAPDLVVALQAIALHAPSLDAQGIRDICDAALAKAGVL